MRSLIAICLLSLTGCASFWQGARQQLPTGIDSRNEADIQAENRARGQEYFPETEQGKWLAEQKKHWSPELLKAKDYTVICVQKPGFVLHNTGQCNIILIQR